MIGRGGMVFSQHRWGERSSRGGKPMQDRNNERNNGVDGGERKRSHLVTMPIHALTRTWVNLTELSCQKKHTLTMPMCLEANAPISMFEHVETVFAMSLKNNRLNRTFFFLRLQVATRTPYRSDIFRAAWNKIYEISKHNVLGFTFIYERKWKSAEWIIEKKRNW